MEDLQYLQEPPELGFINQKTDELSFAMASEPLVGALLRMLAASKPKGRFLELGTGAGAATAWLLQGMDAQSTLISVDTDAEVQKVAQEALSNDQRLTLKLQDGLEFLRSQMPGSFDLVFADAMPGKYDGLAEALAVVEVGGFYVIDDLLPRPNWPDGHAEKVAPLIDTLARNKDFQIVPLIWASGVVVAVRGAGLTV